MKIVKYLQLPFFYDVSKLQQEVNNITENKWVAHYQKLHYEGNWSAIALRSVNGNHNDIIVSPLQNSEYKNTAYLDDAPYLQQVLSMFKCPLQSVRLLKLEAGAMIKEHKDAELNFENGEVRFHIPVITNEAVEFYLDKERIFMKEGECWYCNFNLLHNIVNKSNCNRVHLVIDAVVNDWVTNIFKNNVVEKKEIDSEDLLADETKKQMIIRFKEMNTPITLKMANDLEQSLLLKSN